MKYSRALILGAGLLLIGISIAFIYLLLPEVFRESSVGCLGMSHLIFSELVLLFAVAYMVPANRHSADLPARIALPMMLCAYTMVVAGLYALTPVLGSTVSIGLHLLMAAGLVVMVVAAFIVGGHARDVQAEDAAAEVPPAEALPAEAPAAEDAEKTPPPGPPEPEAE